MSWDGISTRMRKESGTYPERRNCQRNLLPEHQFQEDFIECQVDDARVKQCFRGKLPDDVKDMRPLPKLRVSIV